MNGDIAVGEQRCTGQTLREDRPGICGAAHEQGDTGGYKCFFHSLVSRTFGAAIKITSSC